jgi:hypothetical protein
VVLAVVLGAFMPSPDGLDAQTVRVPTQTTVRSSVNPASANRAVTLTARVSASVPGDAPKGTVEFFDGIRPLGTAELAGSSGTASASLEVTLPAGPHPIIAKYRGSHQFGPSESAPPLPQMVNGP